MPFTHTVPRQAAFVNTESVAVVVGRHPSYVIVPLPENAPLRLLALEQTTLTPAPTVTDAAATPKSPSSVSVPEPMISTEPNVLAASIVSVTSPETSNTTSLPSAGSSPQLHFVPSESSVSSWTARTPSDGSPSTYQRTIPVPVWTSSHSPTALAVVSEVSPVALTDVSAAVVKTLPAGASTLIAASAAKAFVEEEKLTSVLDLRDFSPPERRTSARLMAWLQISSALNETLPSPARW